MTRTTTAVSLIALAASPAAFARDAEETKAFTKADGTTVVSHTALHTKTGVTDVEVSRTRADGQVRTVSEKISPDHVGGFTVSKSVTGFDGQTHTSTGTIGGGRGGHGKA